MVDEEQPNLVILGKQAIDSDNNQTGQMLGALTRIPQGTFASEVIVDGESVSVTREVDGLADAFVEVFPIRRHHEKLFIIVK